MKAKTIKAVLRKNTSEWLETIDNPSIRKVAGENAIITGGCIASMLLRETVNDFDVYFRTREATEAVAHYYVEQLPLGRTERPQPDHPRHG